jgi:hypothetical protein
LEPGETFDGSHYLPLGQHVVKVDHMGLLEAVSYRLGRVRKGGDPDTTIAARNMLNDFQRGKPPFYVRPPEKPVAKGGQGAAAASMVADMPQDAAALEGGAEEEGGVPPAAAAAAGVDGEEAEVPATSLGGRKRGRGRTHEEAVAAKSAKKTARKASRFFAAPTSALQDDFDDLDM